MHFKKGHQLSNWKQYKWTQELTLNENVEFPFKLQPNEVVLSYKKKNKIKYAKYTIDRKISMDDIPR